MKKLVLAFIPFLIIFLLSANVSGQTQAAFLDFDKKTVVVSPEVAFEIQVMVDPGSEQISSIDAYITYDPSLLEAQAVTPLDYFTTVINNIESGKIYIAGLVDDPSNYKTGSGSVATISFKALTEGSGTISYDCQEGVYQSSKVIKDDIDATNIIVCADNGEAQVTVGSGLSSNQNQTSTPSALPKTGIFENVSKIAVPGIILMMLGGVLRLVL